MENFKDFKLFNQNKSFEDALRDIKRGFVASREGWNGKGMFIYMVDANKYPANTDVTKAIYGENAMIPYEPYIALKNAQGTINIWNPSQADLFSNDWMILGI